MTKDEAVKSFEKNMEEFLESKECFTAKGSGINADQNLVDQGLSYMLKRDFEKAFSCFEKPAEQGHMGAQYALGEFYDFGNGVIQDGKKAAYWYKKAAEQGHGTAQYHLGVLFQHGDIVGKNGTKAKYWFTKAIKQGCQDALDYQSKLSRQYTSLGEACRDPAGIFMFIAGGLIFGGIIGALLGPAFSLPGAIVGGIVIREMRKRL